MKEIQNFIVRISSAMDDAIFEKGISLENWREVLYSVACTMNGPFRIELCDYTLLRSVPDNLRRYPCFINSEVVNATGHSRIFPDKDEVSIQYTFWGWNEPSQEYREVMIHALYLILPKTLIIIL